MCFTPTLDQPQVYFSELPTLGVSHKCKTCEVIERIKSWPDLSKGRSTQASLNWQLQEGTFPIQDSIYQAEYAPRVGDGLVRLDALGAATYASPNARSAISRLGWDNEIEGAQLGAIFDSLQRSQSIPSEESWSSVLSGKTLRRADFDNGNGIVDLLVIPLIEGGDRIGSIVLVHDVTELRRRDRALVSKDATIREIHHRVKNNLQTVALVTVVSSMSGLNVPDVKSARPDAAAFRRSIDLGSKTINGRRAAFFICQRSRWK